ncbi:hypothetical protein GCM10008927_30430 [Amylibacter ulvae]|uniref:Uncharacterized protein n=1 Tax=Paramylibacter ulvae TaxID=1651968 RepID=A0ABQ3D915_9RHOB|nr:hypothetical protein GCM10008927_30430 [Amylibacter ulvae]
MNYYDYATENVLKLRQCSKPEQLRSWELEQEAALQRSVDLSEHPSPKHARAPIVLFRRISKLLLSTTGHKP